MAGIKSLGIGSSNGLNMETIDKLRKADENALVRPIEKSIGQYEQKIESIDSFTKLLSTLKTNTASIKDDFLYLQRTAGVIGDGVSAIVEDGVDPQNIDIKVEKLATEHIIQSDSFNSKTASLAAEDTELIIRVGDSEHVFEVKAGMQLRDLISEVNKQAGHDVTASILQTGPKEFRLVLRTKETGENNRIELTQGNEATTKPKTTTETITTALPITYDAYTGTLLTEKDKPAVQEGPPTQKYSSYTGKPLDKEYTLDESLPQEYDSLTGAPLSKKYNPETGISLSKEKEILDQGPALQKYSPYTGVLLAKEHNPLTDGPLPLEYTSEDIEVSENVPVNATKLNVNLYNEVQKPQNAHFTFNGAEITRESNEVDDMVLGLTFTLEEITGENKRVNIKIDQDSKQIVENLQSFITNYNIVMTEVDNMTRYDPDADKIGLFLGENSINTVRTNINNVLRHTGSNGESIANAGVTFNQDGQLEFDSFTFEKALLDDPAAMQSLLQGVKETKNGRDLQKDGLFYKLNEVLDDLVNTADGSMVNFEKSLENQLKRTKEEKETATKRLDNRYETMQNQFAAAGSAIGKLQKGFGAVEMQIKQSQAGN